MNDGSVIQRDNPRNSKDVKLYLYIDWQFQNINFRNVIFQLSIPAMPYDESIVLVKTKLSTFFIFFLYKSVRKIIVFFILPIKVLAKIEYLNFLGTT